ncbi:diguanylate cyclase [bacterium 1XD42-94]|nr:diguanylate cyclase [bacterium 1XD42-76]NBK04783.1 diguanylate cyclase [bacterium 1XD42-94]
MMKRASKPKAGSMGTRIQTMNNAMILIACILCTLLIYVTILVSSRYERMLEHTEDYITCVMDAGLVTDGSDCLSEQVWFYVVTGDTSYIDAYFQEKNIVRRRESALEAFEKQKPDETAYQYLEAALKNSDELVRDELYAMKLVATAMGTDLSDGSPELLDTKLSDADQNLSPEEKIAKAREIVFGSGYRESKALIMNDISHFLNHVLEMTHERQLDSISSLESFLRGQRIYIALLFVLIVCMFISIIALVIRPLQGYIRCIKEGRTVDIKGSYELQYLGKTYNEIYETNQSNASMLRHKAEHDPLTGVINRGGFEELKKVLKDEKKPMAFLIIDVDKFKEVNDGYGHEMGDKVLKRVASLIQESFRTRDFVARIGGDEFCVIMTDITEHLGLVIKNKIYMLNRMLQNPDDDFPAVSLSVGVAFTKEGFTEELYRNADRALYYVKGNGRCGISFYGEDVES